MGGKLKEAKDHLARLREQDRNAFETRHLAASIAIVEGESDKAIGELKEILNKDPARAGVYVEIGQIQVSKKQYKVAEASFRQALEVDSKLAAARVALAQLYVFSGDPGKAEEELIIATKADPENEGLLHVLGSFYSVTKQIDDFEKLYLELLKKKPDSLVA
jgi:Tfp pilus assembly protein PilF